MRKFIIFKRSYILLACFTAIFINAVQADPVDGCQPASIPNACDNFYNKCLEGKNRCGPEGYPLGYGLKYCNVFKSMKLSATGEQWITDTMGCLQDQLVDYVYEEESCDVIKKTAFNSHVGCYLNSGFCELSYSDQYNIAKSNFWEVVTSLEGFNQVAKTLIGCIKEEE